MREIAGPTKREREQKHEREYVSGVENHLIISTNKRKKRTQIRFFSSFLFDS